MSIKTFALPGIIVLVSLFIAYMNFDQKIEISDTTLEGKLLVYVHYQGEYMGLGDAFNQIATDFANEKLVVDQFGFYYDDPSTIVNETQSRAIVGVIASYDQRRILTDFVYKHTQYQISTIPELSAVSSSKFPIRNVLSFIWLTKKIYPMMSNYLKGREDILAQPMKGSLEIYEQGSTIQTFFPYGNNVKYIPNSKYPEPEKRPVEREEKKEEEQVVEQKQTQEEKVVEEPVVETPKDEPSAAEQQPEEPKATETATTA